MACLILEQRGDSLDIGKEIILIRQQHQLTQEDLAEQLHVSRPAVSAWEVGRNYPDIDSLVKMSDLFDITLDQLIRGRSAGKKRPGGKER